MFSQLPLLICVGDSKSRKMGDVPLLTCDVHLRHLGGDNLIKYFFSKEDDEQPLLLPIALQVSIHSIIWLEKKITLTPSLSLGHSTMIARLPLPLLGYKYKL